MYSGQRSEGTGKWEDSEFPIVCEECMGEEVYLRMMKAPFDQGLLGFPFPPPFASSLTAKQNKTRTQTKKRARFV